jgi:hypothetical protein
MEDVKEVNQTSIILALEARLKEVEKTNADLRQEKVEQGAKSVRLQIEIAHLRMTRTDKVLAIEVKALRSEVSTKDRKIREYEQAVENLKTAEVVALKRAQIAEEHFRTSLATVDTMQKARDKAQADTSAANKATAEAVAWATKSDLSVRALETRLKLVDPVLEKAVAALKVLPPAVHKEKAVRDLSAAIGAARK